MTICCVVNAGVSGKNDGTSTLTFTPLALIGEPGAWTGRSAANSGLGFRGSENLGGGLMANFQIEHRFTPDTGGVEPPDGA